MCCSGLIAIAAFAWVIFNASGRAAVAIRPACRDVPPDSGESIIVCRER
jgi:hypothetical protein